MFLLLKVVTGETYLCGCVSCVGLVLGAHVLTINVCRSNEASETKQRIGEPLRGSFVSPRAEV